MDSALSPQLAGFLADLIFVGCLFAALLYGLWFAFRRPRLVNMARLSLVMSFGGTVTLFALGQTQGAALSLPLFYLFVLMALFLILEFLFQMSVLGLMVSLAGLVVGAMHYFPQVALPATKAASPVVAYWWVLRDLAVTTGGAVLTLGLGTAALLYGYGSRRPSPLVHPNDLRDVAAILARGAVPCFFFGAIAGAVALSRQPFPGWVDWWSAAWGGLLVVTSGLWWAHAERRRYRNGEGLGLLVVNAVVLVVYLVRGLWGAG